jgi:ATP-binding cassette subfamily B protein
MQESCMLLPRKPLSFLWHFVKKQKIKFLACAISLMTWAGTEAILPYFLNHFINQVSTFDFASGVSLFKASAGIVILIISIWVLMSLITRIGGFCEVYAMPLFRGQIRLSVFDYAKWHSLEYFSNNFAGSLARKLADLPSSCQTLLENILFQFLPAFLFTSLVLIMMYNASPIFGGIVSVWLVLHFSFCGFFLKKSNALYKVQSEAASTLSGKVVDAFSNILTVRLFSRSNDESDYLKSFQQDEIQKSQHALFCVELSRIGLACSGLFLLIGTLLMAIYSLEHRWINLGQFTQIMMQVSMLLGWMWFVGFQLGVFSRELGQVSDALGILNQPHDLIDIVDAKPLKVSRGELEFKKVFFKYPKGQQVFENLSLKIPAGQKVGLVGFSGSGKSTFVNMILRFYDVASGEILIDGQNIAHVTQESLRSEISMIPQDPSLFHRSLKENIGYGKLGATDQEIIAAAKLAHCDEFIEVLPEKYEALVGERGVKLSGGQRQRISIARAILKDAPILILDEATSALDSVTEHLIQDSLKTMMKDRTTIVVAHRLSTLNHMDRILVFEKGKLVEDGKPADLLAQRGHFFSLWQMQKEGFIPDVSGESREEVSEEV